MKVSLFVKKKKNTTGPHKTLFEINYYTCGVTWSQQRYRNTVTLIARYKFDK